MLIQLQLDHISAEAWELKLDDFNRILSETKMYTWLNTNGSVFESKCGERSEITYKPIQFNLDSLQSKEPELGLESTLITPKTETETETETGLAQTSLIITPRPTFILREVKRAAESLSPGRPESSLQVRCPEAFPAPLGL